MQPSHASNGRVSKCEWQGHHLLPLLLLVLRAQPGWWYTIDRQSCAQSSTHPHLVPTTTDAIVRCQRKQASRLAIHHGMCCRMTHDLCLPVCVCIVWCTKKIPGALLLLLLSLTEPSQHSSRQRQQRNPTATSTACRPCPVLSHTPPRPCVQLLQEQALRIRLHTAPTPPSTPKNDQ